MPADHGDPKKAPPSAHERGPVTTIREAVTPCHYVTAVSFFQRPPPVVFSVVKQIRSSTENARRQNYGSLRNKKGRPKKKKKHRGVGGEGEGAGPPPPQR